MLSDQQMLSEHTPYFFLMLLLPVFLRVLITTSFYFLSCLFLVDFSLSSFFFTQYRSIATG